MNPNDFLSNVGAGSLLIADGATGTNLIDQGLPAGLTAESWVLGQPDRIIQLHRDFIDAGAQIILTSTFSATPLRLRGTALDGQSDAVNRKAVELARAAASGSQVYIAGSLGPVGQLIKPYGPLTAAEVEAAYMEQARSLDAAGVDLLVVETQFDMQEIIAAVQGIRQVSTLPLVVSISYDRGRRTMMGLTPTQAVKDLEGLPVDVLGINCGHSLEENLQNLRELRPLTTKPVWFKPNAGLPHLDASGKTTYDITPADMGALASSWLVAGAQVIGGCCGTTPNHLREIALHVKM